MHWADNINLEGLSVSECKYFVTILQRPTCSSRMSYCHSATRHSYCQLLEVAAIYYIYIYIYIYTYGGHARSKAAQLEPSWSIELLVNCEGKQRVSSYVLRPRCSFLVQALRVDETLLQSGSQLWITTSIGKWSSEGKYLHREIGVSGKYLHMKNRSVGNFEDCVYIIRFGCKIWGLSLRCIWTLLPTETWHRGVR
jgi:hypothetical protein